MRNFRKSIFMLFTLLVFLNSFLYAYKVSEDLSKGDRNATPKHYTKGVMIQGGYDDVAAINITPLSSQAEGYLLGMPFSLNDSSVLAGASEKGRAIAKWNVLTNSRFLIDITAEILHPESEDKTENIAYSNGLGYILTFVYNMSYYSNNKIYFIDNASFPFEVVERNDGKTRTLKDVNLLQNVQLDSNSLVGSADGSVYFIFNETSTELIKNDVGYASLPDGNYIAKVTLTLKVAQ